MVKKKKTISARLKLSKKVHFGENGKLSTKCLAIIGRAYLGFHAETGKRTNRWSFWKC